MSQYSLDEISMVVNGRIIGTGSMEFSQILTDSRKLNLSGTTLFVAIMGERHDGHAYLSDMYEKGVRSFIVSEKPTNLAVFKDAGFLLVSDTLEAFQQLVAYHRNKFSIPILGITGSNGKTIVKEWLSQCLEQSKNVVRSPKSYNSQIGVPLSVWNLNKSTEIGVFEAGISQPGEMEKLAAIIQPTEGIFTNIGEAHQQNFNSLEEKVDEKCQLFKSCERIYYCADYILIHEKLQELSAQKSIKLFDWSFSNLNAHVKIEILTRSDSYTTIQFNTIATQLEFRIPFIDNASIENCIHVINYLFHKDYSKYLIQECVDNLENIAMRLEQVKGMNNCMLINDTYNSDINSLGIALDFLHQQPFKKKTLILSDIQQSGMADKDLYKDVAHLIQQSDIDSFIGIGKNIMQYESEFTFLKSEFYSNTHEFLSGDKVFSFKDEVILLKAARDFRFEQIVSRLSEKNHTTVLEINLNNLVHNLNFFRNLLSPDTRIMVMVKALAYGSGTYEIANLLQHEKVDYLGVAFTDEGIQLRQAGIDIPIMVMSPDIEDFSRLINYDLEPEVFSMSSLRSFSKAVERMQVTDYPIHLKLDTGMHRLGFMENDLEELIGFLKNKQTIQVKGIFSHLAASDSSEHDEFTQYQIRRFSSMYNRISDELNVHPLRHILNTAGIERFPEAHFEMVRLGIGLHGISTKSKLLPVSTLKTHIRQIKRITAGETIGYNRSGKAEQEMTIAIIPIGYADGLDRKFGNGNGQVIIDKQKASFIGDICMDMSMVDITNLTCSEGDEVILFGEELPITTLAKQIDTIPYEILTNVSSRVKRVYYKD